MNDIQKVDFTVHFGSCGYQWKFDSYKDVCVHIILLIKLPAQIHACGYSFPPRPMSRQHSLSPDFP